MLVVFLVRLFDLSYLRYNRSPQSFRVLQLAEEHSRYPLKEDGSSSGGYPRMQLGPDGRWASQQHLETWEVPGATARVILDLLLP
jgi:hypothetical protein